MINWKENEFSHPSKVPSLYHYQRFNKEWIISLLNEKKIKFSIPKDFNDPWDCRPAYKKYFEDSISLAKQIDYFEKAHKIHRPDISEEDRQRLKAEWLSDPSKVFKAIEDAEKLVENSINEQYRVYCLTPKSDCELMWAHYAECHRGICLRFSTKNKIFCSAIKVKYLEDYPVLDFANDTENLLPLIVKSKAWGYEEEYRLISEEKDKSKNLETIKTDNGFFQIPDNSLVSIIMGCQISEDNKSWLEDYTKQCGLGISLKHAQKVPDKYKLQIV